MILQNVITLTGAGSTVAASTGPQKAKIVQIILGSGNGAPVMFGGPNTDGTNGLPLAAGSGQFLPQISDQMEFWQLNSLYFYIASGDKVYVLWATEGSNS
jgi:hypothetical protein